MTSILNTMKSMLLGDETDTSFDTELMVHINTVLMTLRQLGVADDTVFYVTDFRDEWSEILGEDDDLEAIKTYMYLKIKLVFDPPTNSFVLDSMNKQIAELESRINMNAEGGTEDES